MEKTICPSASHGTNIYALLPHEGRDSDCVVGKPSRPRNRGNPQVTVLQSLQESTAMPSTSEHEAEVRFSTPKNTAGYFALRATVPRSLLARLDDPAGISVAGNPPEGFNLAPNKTKESGTHDVDHKHPRRNGDLTLPFKPTNLSKVERKPVAVHARVREGKIRVGGMPPDWIAAKTPFVDAPAPSGGLHVRLSAKPGSGGIALNGNGAHAPP